MATTRKTLYIGNFGEQVCIIIRNNIVLVVITLSRSRLHLYIVTGFVMGSSRCRALCLYLSFVFDLNSLSDILALWNCLFIGAKKLTE